MNTVTSSNHHPSAYFVGIKGVAMTALAELMSEAGWQIFGSDVAEDFVTKPILQKIGVNVEPFSTDVSSTINLVIFTGAHQGRQNRQVIQAQQLGIRCLSHAEALAEWSNQKQSVAVCGVGGKSTISAMIAWVMEKTHQLPSFAVGVGGIIGLEKSGQWQNQGKWCVVEADEYAVDPDSAKKGSPMTPRFAYLRPSIIVATSIAFDHPDVYSDADHTWRTFCDWFAHQDQGTALISHESNRQELSRRLPSLQPIYFGQSDQSDMRLKTIVLEAGTSSATIEYQHEQYHLVLHLPGTYNLENALAAFGACVSAGLRPTEIVAALESFQSTVRRFEYRGQFHGATLYDDYAHHPRELEAVLAAAKIFVGQQQLFVAFQPHTYSRTKALWSEFVRVLAAVPDLFLLDIFSSARETSDSSVSVDDLKTAIETLRPTSRITVCHDLISLARAVEPKLTKDTVFLTLGAGDIYHVHEMLQGLQK